MFSQASVCPAGVCVAKGGGGAQRRGMRGGAGGGW